MKHYIYIYRDPRDHTPIYVGKGQGTRAYMHLKNAENPRLAATIAEYRAAGLEPIITIEERFATHKEACAREMELIAQFGRRLWSEGSLLNTMPGGEGYDEETLRRLYNEPEFRLRNLEHLRRLNTDPELIKRREEGYLRRDATPGYLERRAEAIRNSEAVKEAARRGRGRKRNEETKANLRAAWVRRKAKQVT